mmetsp:Transcript_1314/g.3965  ORF Transcript_1314/g.3965 Transcript_1314/m.3965 type:complete len:220 (-) Transcript_1314:623-1282(-)
MVSPGVRLRLGLDLRALQRVGHIPRLRHGCHSDVGAEADGHGYGLAPDSDGASRPPLGPRRAHRAADTRVQGVVVPDARPRPVGAAARMDGLPRGDHPLHLRDHGHGAHRQAGQLRGGRIHPGALRRPLEVDVHLVPVIDLGHVGVHHRQACDGEGLEHVLVLHLLHHHLRLRLLELNHRRDRRKRAGHGLAGHRGGRPGGGGREEAAAQGAGRHVPRD